ncbi:hdaC, partial [Symbiodinium sp. KB8]
MDSAAPVGRFALHEAAERGDEGALSAILQGGATRGEDGEFVPAGDSDDEDGEDADGSMPDARDGLSRTPVHLAILHRNQACLDLLLEGGANPSLGLDGLPVLSLVFASAAAPGSEGFGASAAAAVVKAGAPLDALDSNGRSPLHWAAEFGLLAAAKAAEAAAKEAADAGPAKGEGGVPEFILNEPDPARRAILMEEYGPSAAAEPEIPEFIRNETDPVRKAILMEEYGPKAGASAAADEEAKAPAEFDAKTRDRRGRTALHAAAEGGHTDFVKWLLSEKSASADVADDTGCTPAHLAAERGHAATLRALVPSMKAPGRVDDAGRSLGDCHAQHVSAAKTAAASARGGAAAAPSLAVVWNAGVLRHRTAPRKPTGVRGASGQRAAVPPPENPERVTVLVHKDYGCLRAPALAGAPWIESAPAPMADVLRVHEFAYVRRLIRACADAAQDTAALASSTRDSSASEGAAPTDEPADLRESDSPAAVRLLDADTSVSAGSWEAALHAAGASCRAVDEVVAGRSRAAFCPVRPPGHHAGPMGRVTCANDRNGSLGFCLLNNVAIAAAYARATYGRSASDDKAVRRVVIVDFDAAVRNLQPTTVASTLSTPFAAATIETDAYKPWLDGTDGADTLFISAHGYGHREPTTALAEAAQAGTLRAAVQAPVPSLAPTVASPPAPDTRSALARVASKAPDSTHGWFYPGSGADAGYEGLPDDVRAIQQGIQVWGRSGGTCWRCCRLERRRFGAPSSAPIAASDLDAAARGPSHDGLAPGMCTAQGALLPGEDATAPGVINVGLPVGYSRADWRRVMAERVLPRVAAFSPDLVLISAGFDGHADDVMNNGYGVLREEDFAWITRLLCGIAKGGRVVSILEGGYAISAGPASPFARSVSEHVRALAEAPPAPLGEGGALAPAGWGWDAAAAARSVDAFEQGIARVHAEVEAEQAAADEAAMASAAADAPVDTEEYGREARRKRRRAVDYAKLNEEMSGGEEDDEEEEE